MTAIREQFATELRRAHPAWTGDGVGDVDVLADARRSGASEQAIGQAIARTLGITVLADLNDRPASALFVERVPISYARQHRVIGLAAGATDDSGDADTMAVAMADVSDLSLVDVLGRFLERPVRPVLAPAEAIQAAINAAYQQRTGQAQQLIERLDEKEIPDGLRRLTNREAASGLRGGLGGGREDLLDVASRAPVIQLVNLILFEAVKQNASDVHVQPYEEQLVVRMRIDGVLFDAFELPKAMQEEMVSRVKVMGRMNIAEKRLPQDGRATVQVGDRLIDLRLSSLPTSFGERIVIRLLDKSARLYTLDELGMPPVVVDRFRKLINVEHGLVLVTGPTGSGKSTTLYAALQELNAKELNIITLEDPIEYQLPGVSQTQVSEKKGMTFASGLRSVLRQDPDIIMVGEIRDRETAVMAIQSALTGHLVFSTLHTNDAASAMTRLLDLGIEPYLAASSVVGVLAQRLVRRACASCASPASPSELPHGELAREAGVVEGGREARFIRATAADVKAAAMQSGMHTLRDDGLAKAATGVTTLDEVHRVTMRATV